MLEEKIAVVTGASRGIGRAIAKELALKGAFVIVNYNGSKQAADETVNEITQAGGKDVGVQCNVADAAECEAFINNIISEYGRIDILVNNAGLAVGTSPIQDGILDDWERMIDTNVKGLLYITHEVAPLMIKNEKGHIVNIASVAGKEVYPGGNVYCATKHAVDALSKAMRIDMLKHNIKVTNIAPGMVETEFSVVRYKGDQQAADNVYKGVTPLTGEDIADTIVFAVTRPAHICLNDIQIMPTAQASSRDVNRK